nr:hypothetical protein HmN_000288400 [Hymenolepis microstoma]
MAVGWVHTVLNDYVNKKRNTKSTHTQANVAHSSLRVPMRVHQVLMYGGGGGSVACSFSNMRRVVDSLLNQSEDLHFSAFGRIGPWIRGRGAGSLGARSINILMCTHTHTLILSHSGSSEFMARAGDAGADRWIGGLQCSDLLFDVFISLSTK